MKRIASFALAAIVLAACSESGPTGLDRTPTLHPTGDLTPASGAWVMTDKDDYMPGDTVVITGGGWSAGETVSLLIEEVPEADGPHLFSAVVDENGLFENRDMLITNLHLEVTFTLTATGQSSGETAQTTFTDHGPSPVTSTNFSITSDASHLVTVSVLLGGGSSTVSLTAATAKVANQTAGGTIDVDLTSPGGNGNGTWSGSFQGVCGTEYKINNAMVTWRTDHDHNSTQTPSNTVSVTTGACSAANQAPTADAGGPYTGNEGSAIQLDGSGSTDSDGTIASYQWSIVSFDNPDGGSCTFVDGESTGEMPSVICDDDGVLTVSLTVTDDDGESSLPDQATVTVSNVPPDITAVILAPFVDGNIYPITGQPTVDATFTDPGSNDTHSCVFEVFDYLNNEVGADRACGSALGATEAGVYNVKVTVTDDDGDSDSEYVQVIVYDPSAGFVTGGGWIYSAAGAYAADPSLEGKATFGFVSKYIYQKDKTTPVLTGNTEFVFQAGNLNFHSSSYEWLVVNGVGTRAQYKGAGTINGGGTLYAFKLTAIDGKTSGPDQFRMQIFETDGETVLYDNYVSGPATEQPLGGGSIMIHTGKK